MFGAKRASVQARDRHIPKTPPDFRTELDKYNRSRPLVLNCDSQFDRVVRRVDQILPGAEVAFSGLDGRVSEEHLNLLKLAARRSAQLRAGAATIMRRDAGHARCGRVLPKHLPDHFFAQTIARNAARAVHRAEYVASAKAGGTRPRVDSDFYPCRH